VRGTREFSYERQPGLKRVVVLGDSFTYGEDVSDEETYCAVLAEQSPGLEVINLGVHGYGVDQMLLYLKEEGLKYRPDVIVVGFPYLDVARDRLAFRDYAKPRFLLRGGQLELNNSPVPPPEQILAEEIYRSKTLDLLSLLSTRLHDAAARDAEARELTAAILQEIESLAKSVGAQPVFVYLPVLNELADTAPAESPKERFLSELARQRHIPCLQLRPTFIKSGETLTTRGHWTPVEHRLAGAALHDKLRELGLID
jgi:hypothetical protein